MALDVSRKRKHSTSTAPDAPSASTSKSPKHADISHARHAANGRMPSRQDFTNFNVQDHARAHIGNIYYNVSSLHGEDASDVACKRFMEALAFKQMDLRRAAIDPAHGKTCRWIFQEERFLRWRASTCQDPSPEFFWIKGKPGSGKSTLMKSILEHLQDEMRECVIISFFFNARGDQLERSTQGCLRSLLHQILELRPKLYNSLRISNIPAYGQDWEIAVVRDKLREAVLQLRQESLVLVIDALDECDLQETRDMIYFLESLSASAKFRAIDLKICLASRHYPNITIRFCENIVVENQEAHARDIHEYLEENLHVQQEEQRQELLIRLIQKSQGVFMWVILVTRQLNEQFDQGTTLKQLLGDLHGLPSDLDTLIQSIINDGASDACLLPILLWTLVANRPLPGLLDLSGFCFAVLFSAGKLTSLYRSDCVVDLDDPDAMKRFVLHSSKGLVEVIQSDSRQFIHESVRQYILDGGLANLHSSLGLNVKAVSSAMVADWCLEYVRNDLTAYVDFPAIPSSGLIHWNSKNDAKEDRLADAFPLLTYAMAATLAHLNAAFSGGSYDLNRLSAFPRTEWIKLANTFRRYGWYLEPTASLIFLCLEGMRLSEESGMIVTMLEYFSRNLSIAEAENDNAETVDSHLRTEFFGRSLNDFCGGRAGTPLVSAAQQGRKDLVMLLLDLGADPNACDRKINQHPELNKQTAQENLAIDLDKIVRGSCQWGFGTPLAAAASQSDEMLPVVELLLARGAKPDVCGGRRGSALGTAIYHGCWAIFNLLMQRGADVNLRDHQGLNIALRQAIEARRRRQCASFIRRLRDLPITMLFRRGLQVEPAAMNIFLHMAARAGRSQAVQLLVNAGADPRCRDVEDRTALHSLIETPQFEIVEFDLISTVSSLLELGVDINACGGDYDTALIAASAQGRPDLVKSLLDHGANMNHRSDKHGNAFDAATKNAGGPMSNHRERNYRRVITMLLDAGMEPSATIST